MRILHLAPGDESIVLAGAELFDAPPTEPWTSRFLASEGHHLLVAGRGRRRADRLRQRRRDDASGQGNRDVPLRAVGAAGHRNRGVGRALVEALADLARSRGCYGMWVGTEPDNAAALAAYLAAGAEPPEPFVSLSWTFT